MAHINHKLSALLLSFPIFIWGMNATGLTMAADDVIARAMKLYEQHHYAEATQILRQNILKMSAAQQTSADLVLGMSYLSSAILYRELYQTALIIELDYLTQLSKQHTGKASNLVDLYLGQALLESGKPVDATKHFQKFAEKMEDQSTLKHASNIELGIAYSQLKRSKEATLAWSGFDTKVPQTKAALAGAYALLKLQKHKPVAMAEAATAEKQNLNSTLDVRMIRNLLRAYSHSGATEKALLLLESSELKHASFVENLSASKSIRYYDTSLLHDIAETHLAASIMYLELASHDAKLKNTASYFLVDAYLQQGNAEASLRLAGNILTQEQLPPKYRVITQVRKASAHDLAGQGAEAMTQWRTIAEKATDDPGLLAVVMLACIQAKVDCTKLEKQALSVAEKGEGKKYFSLNAALGKYYVLLKDFPKAELYMEAGRDKANKNKIEINDPAMLVNLAEAYYRNKKFSETLEIYFELSKQYPVVRQIQEAMQGIYAMEHQSAGEVKIY